MKTLVHLVAIFNIDLSPPDLLARQTWKDVDGNFINAHSAGILHHNGIFYMFGEI